LIDVIVLGSVVFTGDEVIREGYVYVRDGRVEDVGEQPPPEEYTYATLVLGGEGRIVVPGLTAVADAAAYVIRLLEPGMPDRLRFYRALDDRTMAHASLAGVYELHMSGVTSILLEGLSYGFISEVRNIAGGKYGLAVPTCSGTRPDTPEWSLGTLIVSDEQCEGESHIRLAAESRSTDGGEEVLALVSPVSYSIAGYKGAWRASENLRRIMGLDPQGIRAGLLAEIVVFDARRPPGMLLDIMEDSWYRILPSLYEYGLRVESVMIGDDIVVDGGEHLNIVEKHFSEIRRMAGSLLRKRVEGR